MKFERDYIRDLWDLHTRKIVKLIEIDHLFCKWSEYVVKSMHALKIFAWEWSVEELNKYHLPTFGKYVDGFRKHGYRVM